MIVIPMILESRGENRRRITNNGRSIRTPGKETRGCSDSTGIWYI